MGLSNSRFGPEIKSGLAAKGGGGGTTRPF